MATQNTENSNTPKPFGLLSFAQVLAYFKMWKGRNRRGTQVNTATLKTEGLKLPEVATVQTITVQTLSLPITIQMLPSIKTIMKYSNLCQNPQNTVLICSNVALYNSIHWPAAFPPPHGLFQSYPSFPHSICIPDLQHTLAQLAQPWDLSRIKSATGVKVLDKYLFWMAIQQRLDKLNSLLHYETHPVPVPQS